MQRMRRLGGLCACTAAVMATLSTPAAAFTGPLVLDAISVGGRTNSGNAWVREPGYARVHVRSRVNTATRRAMAMSTTSPATLADDEDDSHSDVFGTMRPVTEAPAFVAVQAVFVFAFLGLIDAGFSGDWVARGVLSEAAAGVARSAVLVTAVAHVLLTGVSIFVAKIKGIGLTGAAATLLTGPLGFMKIAAAYDQEQVEAIAAANAPPLSMEINSMALSDRQSPSAVMLSTSIKAKKGREGTMRTLLEKLAAETDEKFKDSVFTCAVNQDPEERTSFLMLTRFSSPTAMSVYQNSEAFRYFTDEAEDCVAEPMGLYMVNERSGKLGEPVHPFGPGGEGGRDDAIYSSPVNLQGSLTGF